jgi:hypothetical protein
MAANIRHLCHGQPKILDLALCEAWRLVAPGILDLKISVYDAR